MNMMMMMNYRLLPLLFWLPLTAAAQPAETDSYRSEIERHRQHYRDEFLTNARSPLRAADTAQLDFYPANPAFRFSARFERTPDARPFDMATYSGLTRPYVQYGVLHFVHEGRPLALAVYQNLNLVKQEQYRDHLFLPFKDITNGEATYGGGRYLDLSSTDIDAEGVLVLDFNKAYNPWCAYSDGYNCPIPPAENHLEVAVEAGERNYRGEKKH